MPRLAFAALTAALGTATLPLGATAMPPAKGPTVRIAAPTAQLHARTAWTAVVSVAPPPAARPALIATSVAGQRLRRPLQPGGRRGTYRATLTFPEAGRWSLAVATGGRVIASRRVAVGAPLPPIAGAQRRAGCGGPGIPYPPQTLAAGGGSLWLTCREQRRLLRFDAAGSRTASIALPLRRPWAVAYAAGAAWVIDRDEPTVLRVDGASGSIAARVTLDEPPVAIWAGAGALWAALDGSGSVARIDPGANAVTRTYRVGDGPSGFASDGSDVWIVSHRDGSLVRIDGGNGVLTPLGTALGRGEAAAERLALAGGALWATGRGLDLVRVDSRTGAVLGETEIGPAGIDLIAAGGYLTVASATTAGARRGDPELASLQRIDPASGAIVRTDATRRRTLLTGLAALDGALWMADAVDQALVRLPAAGASSRASALRR